MTINNPYDSPNSPAEELAPHRRRPWLLYSFLVAALGMLVAFFGLVYGVLLVGVPSQDPTPQMVQREAFHVAVSGWIMLLGACLLFCGSLTFFSVLVTRGAVRMLGKRSPSSEGI